MGDIQVPGDRVDLAGRSLGSVGPNLTRIPESSFEITEHALAETTRRTCISEVLRDPPTVRGLVWRRNPRSFPAPTPTSLESASARSSRRATCGRQAAEPGRTPRIR